MKVGDLVKFKQLIKADWVGGPQIGVVIEIRRTKSAVLDYRNQDSFLVLWPQGSEWSWKSEIKLVPETRSV